MKILVDMNLSPKIAELLTADGITAKHWQFVGAPNAKDSEIVAYAKQHDYIILTCDLDFTALLSASQANKPSVIQVRVHGFQVNAMAKTLALVVTQHADALENGAILTIDTKRARIRILPLGREL